jgi:hypothetical protein
MYIMFMGIFAKNCSKIQEEQPPPKQWSKRESDFKMVHNRCTNFQRKGPQQSKPSQEGPSDSSNDKFEVLGNLENRQGSQKGRGIDERSQLWNNSS